MCRMQMRDLSMSVNDIHAVLFIQERRGEERRGEERRGEERGGGGDIKDNSRLNML